MSTLQATTATLRYRHPLPGRLKRVTYVQHLDVEALETGVPGIVLISQVIGSNAHFRLSDLSVLTVLHTTSGRFLDNVSKPAGVTHSQFPEWLAEQVRAHLSGVDWTRDAETCRRDPACWNAARTFIRSMDPYRP